jgi:hypothetical protein
MRSYLMSKSIQINFSTENSAFQEMGEGSEIARILRVLANKFEDELIEVDGYEKIRDINGNVIGQVTFTKDLN